MAKRVLAGFALLTVGGFTFTIAAIWSYSLLVQAALQGDALAGLAAVGIGGLVAGGGLLAWDNYVPRPVSASDRAVSPVVGVILLLLLTIILVAIISAVLVGWNP